MKFLVIVLLTASSIALAQPACPPNPPANYIQVCATGARDGRFRSNPLAQQLCWDSVQGHTMELLEVHTCRAEREPNEEKKKLILQSAHYRISNVFQLYICLFGDAPFCIK